jgi:hypothetical protein
LDGARVYSSDNKIAAAAPRNDRKPKHGCGTKVMKKFCDQWQNIFGVDEF